MMIIPSKTRYQNGHYPAVLDAGSLYWPAQGRNIAVLQPTVYTQQNSLYSSLSSLYSPNSIYQRYPVSSKLSSQDYFGKGLSTAQKVVLFFVGLLIIAAVALLVGFLVFAQDDDSTNGSTTFSPIGNPSMNLQVTLQGLAWDPDLTSPESSSYTTLEQQFCDEVTNAVSAVSQSTCTVLTFSQGSVIVSARLYVLVGSSSDNRQILLNIAQRLRQQTENGQIFSSWRPNVLSFTGDDQDDCEGTICNHTCVDGQYESRCEVPDGFRLDDNGSTCQETNTPTSPLVTTSAISPNTSTTMSTSTTPPDESCTRFLCPNGRCISTNWICDRDNDCRDWTDEIDCECITGEEYKCQNGPCISGEKYCDSNADCPKGDDESNNCTCATVGLPFCENSGDCIPESWLCNLFSDCSDSSDEMNCGNRECPAHTVRCQSDEVFRCIPDEYICDGSSDCEDGYDESAIFCPETSCGSGQHECSREFGCYSTSQRCDGIIDCTDGSDEQLCVRISSSGVLLATVRGVERPICLASWLPELGNMACRDAGYGSLISSFAVDMSGPFHFVTLTSANSQRLHALMTSSVAWDRCQAVGLLCQERACGQRIVTGGPEFAVVSGDDALPGAWPWQVSIRRFGSHSCGGVLISNDVILSAAHCFQLWLDYEHLEVKLGGIKVTENESIAVYRRIRRIYEHPLHIFESSAYDLVVMVLNESIAYTDYIQPICLPEKNETFEHHGVCWMSGWGLTNRDRGVAPEVLQETKMSLFSDETCRNEDSQRAYVDDVMLCAGVQSHTVSACNGDSGGPLMCEDSYGRWVLTGLVSWTLGVCDTFTVFTQVDTVVDYSQEIVDERPSCVCEGPEISKCLADMNMCDYYVDCSTDNPADELNCRCGPTDGRCKSNGLCSQRSSLCDMWPHCDDGTDELGCTYGRPVMCDNSSYACADESRCIPHDWRCDRQTDCPDGSDEEQCNCGRRDPTSTSSLIIGGDAASTGSWPWLASVRKDGEHICGATLVHPEYLVTAAHCIRSSSQHLNATNILIHIGTTSSIGDDAVNFSVSELYIHPNWNPNIRSPVHDIAILKLNSAVQQSQVINQICLPVLGVDAEYSQCLAAGWGAIDSENQATADTLYEAQMRISTDEECATRTSTNGQPFFSRNETLCTTGVEDSRTSICDGDSGGPLACQDEEGFWILVGVASYSVTRESVACSGISGFMDINFYLNWIQSIIEV